MTAWLRGNRWGLALVIPALLLALAANSLRLQLFWWTYKPHVATSGVQGKPVHFAEDFDDFDGHWHRALDLTVTSVTTVAAPRDPDGKPIDDARTPAEAQWVKVSMHVAASPTAVLFGCRLSLLDASGRETEYTDGNLVDSDYLPISPCIPDAHQGPVSGGPKAQGDAVEAGPRPAAYDVDAYVLTARGFRPTAVRLQWTPPRYVQIALPTT